MKKNDMIIQVAYVCNGKDRSCRKDSCYYKNHGPCMHTLNPKYAKYGTVDDPKNHRERFDKFTCENMIRYYEREETK